MKESFEAKSHITVKAPPETVWKALVTPAQVKKYMMGADVSSDWKVGSPLVYTGTYQGKPFEEKGVIKKIEPGKMLQATYFSTASGKEDKPENYHLVTWQLAAKDGGTEVSVTQDGVATEKGIAASEQNWNGVLQGLKKTVEGSA
jgi:uncharacterized protein YndB with AHSA1/START domain